MIKLISRLLTISLLILIVVVVWAYFYTWRAPATYDAANSEVSYPLLSLEQMQLKAHQITPPYFLTADPLNEGAAFFFGSVYGRLPDDPQYRLIRNRWRAFKPTVALLEGRMGYVIPYLMDPVATYGESGQVAQLAHEAHIPVYSWEVSKEAEVATLREEFSREQVALFVILRPYWGSVTTGSRLQNADKIVEGLIEERGNRQGIEGEIMSLAEIDTIWQRDFPTASDWRDFSFSSELPGYMGELYIYANDARLGHLLDSVMDLTAKGERVFVSAGWEHVIRIEPIVLQAPAD